MGAGMCTRPRPAPSPAGKHPRHPPPHPWMRDSPPPCIWHRYGNLHTFPRPTAYDTHASTNCTGFSHLSLPSLSMTDPCSSASTEKSCGNVNAAHHLRARLLTPPPPLHRHSCTLPPTTTSQVGGSSTCEWLSEDHAPPRITGCKASWEMQFLNQNQVLIRQCWSRIYDALNQKSVLH